MKRIVYGQTYNTETSNEVFMLRGGPYSGGWFALYQTRAGAFFKIRVNHDGEEVLDWGPISDMEAQQLVEQHANHLTDKYFDVIEGGSAERRLTVRVPINLARRVEKAATEKKVSVNTYVMRILERAVKDDGVAAY